MVKMNRVFIGLVLLVFLPVFHAYGQEAAPTPYFVAYDHYMEELNALDIETDAVHGRAADINSFLGGATQFEYGARRWWTSELYLDWQHTAHTGSLYTGFRFENRFRPFLENHRVNPVLYVEYEHLNGADKALKEVVGFDSKNDFAVPDSQSSMQRDHELETRLILSSELGAWNLTENLIAEKNLHGEPWEFGYAVGLSRPLAAPSGRRCAFCAEKFVAGVEMYGGAGTISRFTLRGTSQYIAPAFGWSLPSETTFHFSPGWGLTGDSFGVLFRFGVSQEVDDFGRKLARVFHKP